MSRSERQTSQRKSKQNQQMMLIIGGVALLVVLAIGITVAVFFSKNDPQPQDVDDPTSGGLSLSNVVDSDTLEEESGYDKDKYVLDVDQYTGTILPATADAGQDYIDDTLFIGDSNTYRYMYYKKTTLANDIGIIGMGLQQVISDPCVKFKGYSDYVSIPEAVTIMQPRRIVICFGTNNADGSWSAETMTQQYNSVLDAIEKAYPYADIIISAVPPIAKLHANQKLTMTTIDNFNQALVDMAEKRGCKFLNTSEVLKDPDTGFAKAGYMMDSDGYHISQPAADAIFDYIRTHAYETEDRRPTPLKPIPARDEQAPSTISSERPQTGYKPNSSSKKEGLQIVFAVNDAAMGTLSGELEQIVPVGEVCTAVTATPKEGYTFAFWSCTVGRIEDVTQTELKFVSPGGFDVDKVIVTANFAKSTIVKVTTNDANLGSAGVRDGDNLYTEAEVENGESITLCAVPKADARFEGWYAKKSGSETLISRDAECVYKPEGSVEIVAKFYAYTENLTVNVNDGRLGQASITSRSGNRVTFAATPNAGANFVKWVIGGTEYAGQATVTVDVTSGTQATAHFEAITYTCTASAGTGGTVSASSAQGSIVSAVSITATPDTGYVFSGWTISVGGYEGQSGNATFNSTLSGNVTITANFTKVPNRPAGCDCPEGQDHDANNPACTVNKQQLGCTCPKGQAHDPNNTECALYQPPASSDPNPEPPSTPDNTDPTDPSTEGGDGTTG